MKPVSAERRQRVPRLSRAALTVLFFVLPAGAVADNTATAPMPMGAQPLPVSTGKAHVCADLYPDQAIADHIEGQTILRFTVTVDGTVKDVTVSQSSGSTALDDAAVTCAARWRYKPLPMDVSHGGTVYWRAPR